MCMRVRHYIYSNMEIFYVAESSAGCRQSGRSVCANNSSPLLDHIHCLVDNRTSTSSSSSSCGRLSKLLPMHTIH